MSPSGPPSLEFEIGSERVRVRLVATGAATWIPGWRSPGSCRKVPCEKLRKLFPALRSKAARCSAAPLPEPLLPLEIKGSFRRDCVTVGTEMFTAAGTCLSKHGRHRPCYWCAHKLLTNRPYFPIALSFHFRNI